LQNTNAFSYIWSKHNLCLNLSYLTQTILHTIKLILMKKTALLAAALLSLPILAKAQGYQVALQGAKQIGMAHIGVAIKQDASAAFFNPGMMALLEKNSIAAGVAPISSKTVFVSQNTGKQHETDSPLGTPFYLYGVWGPKGEGFASRLKFGLSVNTPFGSSVDWGKEWEGRGALTSIALRAIFIQPTIGIKITNNLGIGAGFTYMTGSINLQRASQLGSLTNTPIQAELDGSANGIGYNLGIYYQPIKQLALGLSYRSQVDMKVSSGTATFKDIPAVLQAGSATNIGRVFPASSAFSAQLPAPQIVSFGVTVMPSEKLTLATELNYSGWSAYDTLRIDYTEAFSATKPTSSLTNTRSVRNYNDNLAFRFGGQYKVTETFTARTGYAYTITPVPSGSLTPETPDNDRHTFFFGGSYLIASKFSIDAAVQLINVVERKDTSRETNLSGIYKTNVVIGALGVSYSF
jgi:long-chain fatty acid transport protein